jgi:hypothetical protein
MTIQYVSRLVAHYGGAIVVSFALSASAVGLFASSASAFSLVPQQEGEVNVGLSDCLGTGCSYVPLNPVISSVESKVDSSTGTRSRLFVDRTGTANAYAGVQFLATDIGTADETGAYWFRPVSMQANGVDPKLEKGQLEVGTFRFNFASTLEYLNVRWFDVEYLRGNKGTGYTIGLSDGSTLTGMLATGPNKNIQSQTFNQVNWIELNLGERAGHTGDGVNFQAEGEPESVPEPGLTLGLGVLAIAGLTRLRKHMTQMS